MDLPSDSVPPSTVPGASGSTRSLLGRSITRRGVKSAAEDEQEGQKGPLGLTTLYEPDNQAIVDLVFVHGLNGGSVTCVHYSPVMSSKGTAPIIFVGHSMGGLVIKKAYILGHELPEYASLVSRVYAIFFLGTPHQGAGIAQLLSRVLALAPGSRPFVKDLSPQSAMLQSINEAFPRYSQNLQLFSFYETLPMYYGIGKGLIVEKHCAVMNYPNERRTYLDANHRDVARFSARSEPSYVLVRNALAMAIENQRSSPDPSWRDVKRNDLLVLSKFLGVSSAPEDDLMTHDFQKHPGSCEWFTQGEAFQQWRDGITSKVFWLRGRPGAGKSVLASHVISHLCGRRLDCSYYFFAEGDKSKTSINPFLRSMAWQMAVLHPEAFSEISYASNNWQDTPVDKVDHYPVWRHVFSTALLKVRLKKPQYWVIDALDECKNGSELFKFLGKLQEKWPLHVLVTSRPGLEAYVTHSTLPMEVISETIMEENKSDIESFLTANLQNLPGATIGAQQSMADQILRNSNGCFLWVNLVLKELRQAHTSAEISQVLDSNPSDMDAFYSRILDGMSHAKFGKDLARAILTWTTCAFRPLSVEEIQYAVEKDMKDSVDDIEKSISSCCGNLVYPRLAKPMNIASSKDCTALALSNGNVLIHDNATLLERHTFKQGEPVRSIAFSSTGKLLATGGAKTVQIWDLDSSEQVLAFKIPAVCMALAFDGDDVLVAVTKNNLIIYWCIVDDAPLDTVDWTSDLREGNLQLRLKQPTMAAISVAQGLLAVIYRGEDIVLWSLNGDQVYDRYTKDSGSRRFELAKAADGSTTVWVIAFSTTIEANLLVAAYSDGDLVVFDTDSGTCRGSIEGINAQTMSCSPDGRTLATADSHGIIHLFDLKTLKLIYRIRFDADALRTKMLVFTSDNLRLLDIRGHQFRHDTLWSLSPEDMEEYIARIDGNTKPRWAVSPLNDDVLVRFESSTASFFSWKTLERIRSVDLAPTQNNIESVAALQHPQYLFTAGRERPHERGSPTTYHLWDFRDLMFQPALTDTSRSELVTVEPALEFGALGLKVESVIGVANERIIFLTRDNWVCSAQIGLSESDLSPTARSSRIAESVVRHFFIPDEWSSLVHRVLVDVRPSGEIIFVKRTELAVIRRGLEITERGAFNTRRTSSTVVLQRRPADKRPINV
ncbi:hypothetical protein DL771_012356 [Monosporascus sp. 5C6A]|nr:hypothetical protein DL771_012356 [Monosporascus sp. 5C6A]